MHRVAYCVIRFGVPQPTKWQHIGNQINAAMIFARTNVVNVHQLHSGWLSAAAWLVLVMLLQASEHLDQASETNASELVEKGDDSWVRLQAGK